MLWLITLLVLAVVAFYVVKMMKSNTQKQQAEHDQLQCQRLDSAAAPDGSTNATRDGHADTATTGVTESPLDTTAATAAAAAGVTATAMASDVAATGTAARTSTATSAADNLPASGDTLTDVREMIKILNLDGPDAARLQIQRDQLVALRKGDAGGVPDAATLDSVASKLREMLA